MIKRAARHPEHLQLDATAKTNNVALSLIYVVGADGEGRNNVWLAALQNGETSEAYSWLLQTAVPFFYGTVLAAVHTILSDGDHVLERTIDAGIAARQYGGGKTRRLLCYWHTVLLALEKKLGKYNIEASFMKQIKHALQATARNSNSINDVERRKVKLMRFLDRGEDADKIRRTTRDDIRSPRVVR